MVGIYKITSPSGRIYIGQSKDLNRRERDYQKYIKDSNSQVKLLASINKYNWENHIFEIIEECEFFKEYMRKFQSINIQTLYAIEHLLKSAKVDNAFDMLTLNKQLLPMLDEVIAQADPDNYELEIIR